jgi:LysM repeat protein
MNNPNPFVPKGSLLEEQSKRRSHFKWGVLFVLTIGVVGLGAMLFQGCKREEENPPESDNNPPPMQTNDVTETDTNPPSAEMSNAPTANATPEGTPQAPGANVPPPSAPPEAPVVPPTPAPPTESEYVVVKGDYLAKIAKENSVTLKALEEANPGITPTRLKIGQKLVIPAGVSTTGANAAGETAAGVAANGDQIYVVKPGDSLTRIAHHFGVTIKAIETENNLTTTKIKSGQKLQIPARPEAGPAPVNAPPQTTTAPESAPVQSNPPAPSAPSDQPPAQPSGQQ